MNLRISESSRRSAGFTFPEIMMASAIFILVVAIIVAFSMFTGRSFAAMTNYIDLESKSRNALDVMIREVRQAKAITFYTNNMIKLTGITNELLVYRWDSGTRELTRSVNGKKDAKPLLSGCDQLSFKIYQRTPSTNGDFYAVTTNLSQCKLINVAWLCSRTVLGKKVNTESVQTTKIVLRNQKVTN